MRRTFSTVIARLATARRQLTATLEAVGTTFDDEVSTVADQVDRPPLIMAG